MLLNIKEESRENETNLFGWQICRNLEGEIEIVMMIAHFAQSVPPLPRVVQRSTQVRHLRQNCLSLRSRFGQQGFARHHWNAHHELSVRRRLKSIGYHMSIVVGECRRSRQNHCRHANVARPGQFLTKCGDRISTQQRIDCIQIDPRRNGTHNVVLPFTNLKEQIRPFEERETRKEN